ncbi:hypothetical protein FAX13_00140 [Ligilactobacillus animalis]|nr:hypothetical protein FAX13_00140 [Ligilactobacillus animalis]
MFITELTKRDWYRIYKYLWKAKISPKRARIFAKSGTILLVLLAVYLLAPTILRVLILLLFRIPFTVSISYSGAFFITIIVFLLIFYYPLLFLKELRIFSPKVFITLTKSTDHFKLKKICKQCPTAYITAGLFSPSSDSDLIAISFKDCYLLVKKRKLPYDPKRYFILPSVIRYRDISNKTDFYKQLDSICKQKINYSKITLLHEK